MFNQDRKLKHRKLPTVWQNSTEETIPHNLIWPFHLDFYKNAIWFIQFTVTESTKPQLSFHNMYGSFHQVLTVLLLSDSLFFSSLTPKSLTTQWRFKSIWPKWDPRGFLSMWSFVPMIWQLFVCKLSQSQDVFFEFRRSELWFIIYPTF